MYKTQPQEACNYISYVKVGSLCTHTIVAVYSSTVIVRTGVLQYPSIPHVYFVGNKINILAC